MRRIVETSKGILHPEVAATKFHIVRYEPAPDLRGLVERYWIVRWNLRADEEHVQELLSYPCVNAVIQRGRSGIFGVVSERSTRRLTGEGIALGVKFAPGGFYPFFRAPLSTLTNRSIRLEEALGDEGIQLERLVLSRSTDEAMLQDVEAYLRSRQPRSDNNIALIQRIVDNIAADRSVTKVDQVVNRFNVNKRRLQRLFKEYVGVGPKWVIRRYRLQEAAEILSSGRTIEWSELALELGYFDQAHFIKDFRGVVGCTPTEYLLQGRSRRMSE